MTDGFVGMDFAHPGVGWPALASAFGVEGVRVSTADDLAHLLDERTADDPPLLVEVPVEPFGGEG